MGTRLRHFPISIGPVIRCPNRPNHCYMSRILPRTPSGRTLVTLQSPRAHITAEPSERRGVSTSTVTPRSPQAEHIAILGGGITGLTTAYYLSRRFPNTRITILESQPTVGGWIRTKTVDLGSEYGKVVLEAGPRTLRSVSKPLIELVNLLNLQDQLVLTEKTSSAARNRFLCFSKPDGEGLYALPSGPISLFTSRFFFTLVPAVIIERYWPLNRPQPIPLPDDQQHKKAELASSMKVYDDESVDAFLTRRFGPKIARQFGSALVHGVYATDSRLLSVRAAFPSLWDAEDRGRGSVISGILRAKKSDPATEETFETGELMQAMDKVSVFSFKDGMQTLPDTLSERLRHAPNVDIRLSTTVAALQATQQGIEMRLEDGSLVSANHVVSTIALPKLDALLPPIASSPPATSTLSASSGGSGGLPHLKFNPASTVTVVNLVFPCRPEDLHPPGFGYLRPRSVNGYYEPESEIIGTVFDSCALSAQDETGTKPMTKLTVMYGGPYYTTEVDSEREGGVTTSSRTSSFSLDKLLESLFKQLGKPRMEPIHVEVYHQQDCIPTFLVGHVERMEEMRKVLGQSPWEGRLHVTGAGVDGVGIADCVAAGRKMALSL